MKPKKKHDISAYLFILPSMIIISMFILYPTLWSLVASMKRIKILQLKSKTIFEAGRWVGLENFAKVLSDDLFLKALKNTIYFGAIFIPLTMGIALALAVLMNKRIKGGNIVQSIVFIPYVISIISAGLIFTLLFNSQSGLVNSVLSIVGLGNADWLGSTKLAMPVIAIMSSWRRIGYFMLIYMAGLQNIPDTLYEAADIEGAGPWAKFREITWPLLGKINTVAFLLLLIQCFNVFQEVFVMTGGGPADSTTTVPFLIYNQAFKYFNIGSASAMSYILFLIVVVVTLIQKKLSAKE